MIHSFLLIGQSNAAGRGFIHEAEPLETLNGRLKVLRNGRWLAMYRPVNPDRSFSGTCLAETFALRYALEHPDVEVGIIPCADGGTALSQWMPGEILFDNAVNCARLAMRTSILCGFLWHQGETDCAPEKCETYFDRFKTMADALKEALGTPRMPIVVGGLGDFLAEYKDGVKSTYPFVNAALERLGREYPLCAFASAQGLKGNPDHLHFSAADLKEFGERYFEAYRSLGFTPEDTKPAQTDAPRTAMELL